MSGEEKNTKKEAKYYTSKRILEDNPKLLNTDDKTATRDAINLVGKENYERFMKERDGEVLKEQYKKIISILKKYIILDTEYYPLIALWIIGTYIHDNFNTFPLLYINATKGSGKSRLIKLIISLSKNGKLVNDLKESVLFRTAKGNTIGIDEFENVGNKELSTIRTMLNSAYKKGVAVERMKKVSKNGKEEFEVERYDLYTSIVLANIWGMDSVVSDRCLIILMDKSNDPIKTRLIEDFDNNTEILEIKRTLQGIWCSLCSVVTPVRIEKGWNDYLLNFQTDPKSLSNNNYTKYIIYNTTLTTLYKYIYNSQLNGRDLELFFPLYIIGGIIDKEVFDDILSISKKIVSEKRNEEYTENKDVSLLDFVSKKTEWQINYVSVHQITLEFKQFILGNEEDLKWLNSKWMGRALKRLKVITSKRRMGKGIEVTLNISKAMNKIRMFKEVDKDEQNKSERS